MFTIWLWNPLYCSKHDEVHRRAREELHISVKNNIIRLKISQSYFLIQVHHLHIQTRVAFDFRNGSTFLGLPEGQNMVTLYDGTSVK